MISLLLFISNLGKELILGAIKLGLSYLLYFIYLIYLIIIIIRNIVDWIFSKKKEIYSKKKNGFIKKMDSFDL